ncbi:post-GPI attachment to proteins factor 3 [Aethina tumida]|uniref:post-GPI attachment to proteins factor 3 n=1 Tax=Aethina tumida TaxID=116153 RepID=UPI00214929A8|nr:post-GPI attachment to proteins factor 3 [Aethina tumida]
MNFLISTFIFIISVNSCISSAGDNSMHFLKCVEKCTNLNCADALNINFLVSDQQPLHLRLLNWNCGDECKHECMWKTVENFHQRGLNTPQFYGKWPFIRVLGIQEPASVLFSLLNFYMHLKMIMKFRKEVRPDSPCYWLWHIFCLVCLNAWVWSTVFHTRDSHFTELMDYACAFSMILITCYTMVHRILRNVVMQSILIIIATFFLAFFFSHVTYLSQGRFDYKYNMIVNILVGTTTGACWFVWCTLVRHRQSYVWKCAIFVALTGMVLLLEVADAPPFLYLIDCHALWHLSTAILIPLYYSFAIDDCKYMRKQEAEKTPIKKRP